MRYLIALIGFIFSFACNSKYSEADIKSDSGVIIASIPPKVLLSTTKGIAIKGNLCYYNDSLYAGYIEEYSPCKKLIARMGFLNGQKQGIQQQWYENGQIKEIRYYQLNKKTGKHTSWWDNGNKRFEYVFDNDLPIKRHCQWYRSGKLYSLFEYNNAGQPEGAQQLWYEDGSVKSNYVVKDNRRFGFLGAKGCEMR